MTNQFPAFFFHLHKGRTKVFTQQERDALGAEWSDSPATAREAYQNAMPNEPDRPVTLGEPVAAAIHGEPTSAPPATLGADAIIAPPPVDAATADEQERQAVWSAPAAVIVESLDEVPRDVLERIKTFEQENPKGPRVTIIRAIDKLLEAPPNDGPSDDAEPPPAQ